MCDAVCAGGDTGDLAWEAKGETDGWIECETTGFIDAFGGQKFIQAARSSLRFLERAIERIPDRPGFMEGDIGLHFGLALHMSGQQALAIRSLTALISGVQLPVALSSQLVGGLVFIHLFNCDLPRAEEQAHALAAVTSECHLGNTKAWSQYLLAFIRFQANELDPALHLFAQIARERHVIEPKGAVDALAGMSLCQELMGRTTEADETLDRLEGFARELSSPEYLLVADFCRARVELLRGEIGAGHWACSVSSCTTPDALFAWLEVPAITRARILLAFASAGSLRDAADQLQEIRNLSEACVRCCFETLASCW